MTKTDLSMEHLQCNEVESYRTFIFFKYKLRVFYDLIIVSKGSGLAVYLRIINHSFFLTNLCHDEHVQEHMARTGLLIGHLQSNKGQTRQISVNISKFVWFTII